MNHRQSILEWITTIIKYVLIVILILFFVKESKRFYEIGYSVFAQRFPKKARAGLSRWR